MSDFIKFLILGLGAGAMYGLSALGLVLVYKASSVVNFSQGAIGLCGAYAYYETIGTMPKWAGLLVAVVTSAVLGLLTNVLILGPMERRGSSPLQRVIATLGVLAVVQQALIIRFDRIALLFDPVVPTGPVDLPGTIVVGRDRFFLLGVGVVLAVVLGVAYRYTRFGMATSAAAENSVSAAALGWSPGLIKSVNWALGGALSGLAATLIGSFTGLSPVTGWLTIIPALAAAMLGGFSSFQMTFAGGLLIGVLESEASNYAPRWTTATPFLVIIAVLILRGKALPLRGYLSDRLPRIGAAERHPVIALIFLGLAVVSVEVFTKAWIDAFTTSLITAILALSLVVLTGYAGQISLAQYAVAGIGALVAGRLADAASMPFLPAVVIGVAATMVSGVLVGLPALRVRGVNLAIATLGLGVAVQSVVLSNQAWTGGPIYGTRIPPPSLFGLDIESFNNPATYAYVCLGAFVLCALVVSNIRCGRSGRRLLAVRDNERAAASIGVSVLEAKLYAFAVASALAGLAGTLIAFRNPSLNFTQFEVFHSITLVTLVVIGGIGYVSGGAFAGAAVVAGVFSHIMSHWFETTDYYLLVLGLLLLVQLTVVPDGAAADITEKLAPLAGRVNRRRHRRNDVELATAPSMPARIAPQALELRDVTVQFGSVRAVDNVSMSVAPGEVVGLIGPNGAGKTTLIDAACGFVPLAEGRITLGGHDVTSVAVHARGRRGLVRSWQSLELFESLTVRENLLVASDSRSIGAYVKDLAWPGRPALRPEVMAIAEELELVDVLDERTTDLSYAQRHLVSIARAMASSASVLLLDEPAAGLDEVATNELSALIRRLAVERGMAVLLIEHDVPLVMRTCDRIVVVQTGRVIAEGTPEELRGNAAVIDAYLGAEAPTAANIEQDADAGAEPAPDDGSPLEPELSSATTRSGWAAHATGVPLLTARGASAGYGARPVVHELDIEVHPGEVVALLGANGAGKTTTLRMLAGVLATSTGSIDLRGQPTRAPLHRRARSGVSYVTEERSIFRGLTTEQNLRLGRGGVDGAVELVPQLERLLARRAGVLSGGEQQMLTLARSLASNPSVLLADELSLGLAPMIVQRLFAEVRRAADERGTGVLLVEQQVRSVLNYCDRAYVLRRGRIVMSVTAAEFAVRLDEIEEAYLGTGADGANESEPVAVGR